MWALGVDTVFDLSGPRAFGAGISQLLKIPPTSIIFSHETGRVNFDKLRGWMNEGRPIMSRTKSSPHARVIAGYCIEFSHHFPYYDEFHSFGETENRMLLIFDPDSGPRWDTTRKITMPPRTSRAHPDREPRLTFTYPFYPR